MTTYPCQVEQFKVNDLIVSICYDTDPLDPRREFDQVGTMVCWHRRHTLGDTHEFRTPQEFAEWWEENGKGGVMLPLYLYDHSGLTMQTTPFACPWDSGQVGWIYATAERIRKCGSSDPSATLRHEVEQYDQYLQGEIYGFSVEDMNGQFIDGSWGYFGLDHCRDMAKEVAEGVKHVSPDATPGTSGDGRDLAY